jgi:hypothetical protein
MDVDGAKTHCMHVNFRRAYGLTRSERQGGHAAAHKLTCALGRMRGPDC